jgi:hypothetical protein
MKQLRALGFLSILVFLAAPLDAAAQTSVRPARVGYLNLGAVSGTPGNPSVPRIIPALVSGLQELGHDVGRTLVLEFRHAEFKPERLPVLAVELVRLPVDVILVAGPAPLDAARKATQTIPIVMVAASDDPVRDGLVASLARPGGNITGLTFAVSPEIAGKQLELLRELAPAANRVRMVADADTIALRRVAEAIADAAPRLHFRAQEPLETREPWSLSAVLRRSPDAHAPRVASLGPETPATPTTVDPRQRRPLLSSNLGLRILETFPSGEALSCPHVLSFRDFGPRARDSDSRGPAGQALMYNEPRTSERRYAADATFV